MLAELSRDLGEALGTHPITPAERVLVNAAAAVVDTFDELPPEVQALIDEIEQREFVPVEAVTAAVGRKTADDPWVRDAEGQFAKTGSLSPQARAIPNYVPPASLSVEDQRRAAKLVKADPQIFATVHDRIGSLSNSGNLSQADAAWLQSVYEREPAYVNRLAQESRIEERLNREAKKAGETAKEFKAGLVTRLKELVDDKPTVIRVTDDALGKILESGRVKTSLEPGVRRAPTLVASRERRRLGEQISGVSDDVPLEQRPVYGYVAIAGIEASLPEGRKLSGIAEREGQEDVLSVYGKVQVVLKPQVRDRTTVTVGDSLDEIAFVRPSPIDNPSALSIGIHNLDRPGFTRTSYVEAQIHGGVRTEDIAEVIFPSPPPPDIAKRLEQQGITSSVLRPGEKRDQGIVAQPVKPTKPVISPTVRQGKSKIGDALKTGVPAALDEFTREQLRRYAVNTRKLDVPRGASPDQIKAILRRDAGVTEPQTAVDPRRAELSRKKVKELRDMAAAHGISVKGRALKADLVEALAAAGNEPSGGEDQARTRQQRIDDARVRADVLADVEESLLNEVPPEVMARSVAQAVQRAGLESDPDLAELLAAVQAEDFDRIVNAVEAAAGTLELTKITSADGDAGFVRFNRGQHQMIPGLRAPEPGTPVEIVRPGYIADIDGEQVVLSKAAVQTDERPTPRPTDSTDLSSARTDRPATRSRRSAEPTSYRAPGTGTGRPARPVEPVPFELPRSRPQRRRMDRGVDERIVANLDRLADTGPVTLKRLQAAMPDLDRDELDRRLAEWEAGGFIERDDRGIRLTDAGRAREASRYLSPRLGQRRIGPGSLRTPARSRFQATLDVDLDAHLPGRHDQSTHGRRKAPAAASPRPRRNTRRDDVARAMSHLDNLVYTGKNEIPGMQQDKLRVARQIREGLLRQAELVPHTAMTLTGVGYPQWWTAELEMHSVNAAYNGDLRNIGVSSRWAMTPRMMQQNCMQARQVRYNTPWGTESALGSTVAHEFGHHVMREIYNWVPDEQTGTSAGMPMDAARRLMRAASRALGVPEPDYAGEPDQRVLSDRALDRWYLRAKLEIMDMVSSYGANDGLQEFFAEVWREYSTMGDDARPHIKTIGKAMASEAERAAKRR